MPFIGQQPITGAYSVLDDITTSATATYNLQLNSAAYSPASANNLLVSLNGVIQKPGSSFTISGSQITFSSALTSSDSIDFIIALGDVLSVGTPTDGSVSTASLAPSAVTDAKIAGMAASKLTGALPAISGAALTGLDTDAVLLQSQTASGASAITVGSASLFSSTYIAYKIVGSNIHHSSDGATGRALFVLDGTEKTGFNYRRVRARMYSGSASITSDRAHSGDAFWDLCYGESIGNATGEMTNFEMTIWSPHTTDNFKGALCQSFGTDLSGASCQWQFSAAHYNAESNLPLTGVKFYPAAGNIASGEFRLYGLKSS